MDDDNDDGGDDDDDNNNNNNNNRFNERDIFIVKRRVETLLQMCSCSFPSPLYSTEWRILSERQLKTTDWKHSLLVKKFELTYTVSKASVKREVNTTLPLKMYGEMCQQELNVH